MIPKSQLQEFGFVDEGKFPRRLVHHAVSMTLPSAIEQGQEPLEVIVDDGLVVPLQKSASSSGMIIRSDGMMLYVWHRDPNDARSPLAAQFIKEIPYDARVEVSNIMRRAVAADSSLADTWAKVSSAWVEWFPAFDGEGAALAAGKFKDIHKAWSMIGRLTGSLTEKAPAGPTGDAAVKFIVQSEADFKRGWQGEEILVDEIPLSEVTRQVRSKNFLSSLFPKMQMALRNPVFHPHSSFCLYYGSSSVYMIKLVVVPPEGPGEISSDAAGIEFNLTSSGGVPPVQE